MQWQWARLARRPHCPPVPRKDPERDEASEQDPLVGQGSASFSFPPAGDGIAKSRLLSRDPDHHCFFIIALASNGG